MVWFLIETSEIVDNDNNADQSFHVNDALHISHKFSASQIQDSQILNKLLYYKLIKIFAIQKAEQVRGIPKKLIINLRLYYTWIYWVWNYQSADSLS